VAETGLSGNLPPVIVSVPLDFGATGLLYRYAARAADPDPGDTLSWTLTTAPAGMSVSADGLVQWIPTAVGAYDVTLSVTDAGGLSDVQAFTINVEPGPPAIDLTDLLPWTEKEEKKRMKHWPRDIAVNGTEIRIRREHEVMVALVPPYPVTADTLLEFDFASSREDEMHAIGLDDDRIVGNPARLFQLYGKKTDARKAIQDFHDYGPSAPAFRRYVIPVGEFYTGEMPYLTFRNMKGDAVSEFRGIRIYERRRGPAPPVAVNDSYVVQQGGVLRIGPAGVLDNDADPNGDPLLAELVSDVRNGTLNLNPDGSFTYTPNANFMGVEAVDRFTYVAVEDKGPGSFRSDPAVVTLRVTPGVVLDFRALPLLPYGRKAEKPAEPKIGEDPPGLDGVSISPDGFTLSIERHHSKAIDLTGLVPAPIITAETMLELDFAAPARGEVHAIGLDHQTKKAEKKNNIRLHGKKKWGLRGAPAYTASPGFQHLVLPVGRLLADRLDKGLNFLTLVNWGDEKKPAGVSRFRNVVIYEPQAPVAQDDTYIVYRDTVLSIETPGVLANDIPGTGAALQVENPADIVVTDAVTGLPVGAVRVNNDGSFVYTPEPGYTGTAAFRYRATDGTRVSNAATATLVVEDVPTSTGIRVQCPGDANGDAVPDPCLNPLGDPPPGECLEANPLYDERVKCMHLSSGDGFVKMADGKNQFVFSYADVTGVREDEVMTAGLLAAAAPAPTIELTEGDQFYLNLTNVGMMMRPDLFDAHTVHWHGLPEAASVSDGVPDTSIAINMGATLTYYYNVSEPGTYFYHCHVEATEHMQMGMIGNLYVHPEQNGSRINFAGRDYTRFAYNDGDGSTGYHREYPIQLTAFDPAFHDSSLNVQPLPFANMKDKYGLINGRGYPDTVKPGALPAPPENGGQVSQPHSSLVTAERGERVLLRISNVAVTRDFTIRTLGLSMQVVGKDSRLLRNPVTGENLYYETDTLIVAGGDAYDVILDTAQAEPGTYFLYTTNLHYLSNNTEDLGGIMTEIVVCSPGDTACLNP